MINMGGSKVSKAQLSPSCSFLFSVFVIGVVLLDAVSCHSRYLSYQSGAHHEIGHFPDSAYPSEVNSHHQGEYHRYQSNVFPKTKHLEKSSFDLEKENHGIQSDFERAFQFQLDEEHLSRTSRKSHQDHPLKSKHHHKKHHPHHVSTIEHKTTRKLNQGKKDKQNFQNKESNLRVLFPSPHTSQFIEPTPNHRLSIDFVQPDSSENLSKGIEPIDSSPLSDPVHNEDGYLPSHLGDSKVSESEHYLHHVRDDHKAKSKQYHHIKHHKKTDLNHHKHHHSKMHHYHHPKPAVKVDSKAVENSKDQTPHTNHGVSLDLNLADIPELEGFVLQDYHEEDFRNIQPQMEDHLPEWKISDESKSLVTKDNDVPILPEDNLEVGVEKFEDFDLTVFDVPSLTRYPKFYTTKKDDSGPNQENKHGVSPKRNKKPLFNISTKLPNSFNHGKPSSILTRDEKHHIARRVGDSSSERVATIQGKLSVMNSEIDNSEKSVESKDSRLGNEGQGVKVRKSALVYKKFLTNKRFSHGKSMKNQHTGGGISKSRSRREEGGPSVEESASLKERPEPLDLEAATANRNTEMDAEVDAEDINVDADILSHVDILSDVDILSGVDEEVTEESTTEEVITTSVKTTEHALTTLTPTVTTPLLGFPPINCTSNDECSSITSAVCEDTACECPQDLPVFVPEVPSCFRRAMLNTTCQYTEQCSHRDPYALCSPTKICTCIKGFILKSHPSVGTNCVKTSVAGRGVDPAMIGILVGLAVMFVIIVIVLRLFSKARFRETRSIFNTPNPRLMNASLFKDSKLLSPSRGDRRGSRASVRPPSRTASLASVNAATGKSPNGSLTAKGRRGSTISTASGPVGTPGHGSARNGGGGGSAETPKASGGSAQTPSKDKKEDVSVAIETVD